MTNTIKLIFGNGSGKPHTDFEVISQESKDDKIKRLKELLYRQFTYETTYRAVTKYGMTWDKARKYADKKWNGFEKENNIA